jgi:hypothetical protein
MLPSLLCSNIPYTVHCIRVGEPHLANKFFSIEHRVQTPRSDSRMTRLIVDCRTLRTLALTTPPTALESLDAGLTPDWRRQKRSSRFERVYLYISSLESSVGVATRFVGRLNCRVLSARVESAYLGIQHTMRMRHYCHLWPAPLYSIFPHYLINGTIFEKSYRTQKACFDFLYNFCLKHLSV